MKILLAGVAALIATGTDVAAQQSTSATYQDWVLQCVMVAKPAAHKLCDIAQVTQVKGKNIPFSRVAVERLLKGHSVKLSVQLPVNVSLAKDVRIEAGDTSLALSAPFARCVPTGCFANFDLKDETFQKIHAAQGVGKISFENAGGHEITVPLSFKGFRQAFDALPKG